jgi:hypothetical protein
MKVNGRCHCGSISFEAEVDPATAGVCHCTDCQNLTGSAWRISVRASGESFRLSGEAPTIYVKTADSGARRAHAFCPKCGTPIYAAAIENPTAYSLRVGTLAERAELCPQRQIWRRSALPWALDLHDTPSLDGQPA